jgi:hypothetical protein
MASSFSPVTNFSYARSAYDRNLSGGGAFSGTTSAQDISLGMDVSGGASFGAASAQDISPGVSLSGGTNPLGGASSAGAKTADAAKPSATGAAAVSGKGDLRAPAATDEERDRECQTCKNRKYQDGSDEMVSFKSPAHIDPQFAGGAVRAHEQEHVSNAYTKAAEKGGKVLSAAVTIHMAVCPECGRSFVSGGTTHTKIQYPNEKNPYQKHRKATDFIKYGGRNADYGV